MKAVQKITKIKGYMNQGPTNEAHTPIAALHSKKKWLKKIKQTPKKI